mgnify:CR=1 FL=1
MVYMSNLTLERPTGSISLSYGFDASYGFVLSVIGPGDARCHFFSIIDGYEGLAGVLETLVETGAFDAGQITEALCAVLLGTSEESIDSPQALQVCRIVRDLVALAPVRRACV